MMPNDAANPMDHPHNPRDPALLWAIVGIPFIVTVVLVVSLGFTYYRSEYGPDPSFRLLRGQ